MNKRGIAWLLAALLLAGTPAALARTAEPEKSAPAVENKAPVADWTQAVRKAQIQKTRNAGKAVQAKSGKAEEPAVSVQTKAESPAAEEEKVKKPDFNDKRIEINLASRLLTLYQGDVGIRMYPVAPGKPDSPTPLGRRKVVEMIVNPEWIDPDDPKNPIPSGPDCPLGYRWIGIGGNYGIHGTNNPRSIGSYASHGCVRMWEKDVEDLFQHIVMGIPVDILYERVVLTKGTDGTVSYYIYPDGYSREPLTAKTVRKKINAYADGAGNFVSDEELEASVRASDGTPREAARVYDLVVGGKKLSKSAVEKNGTIYLPALDTARALSVRAEWSPNWQELRTPLGKARGDVRNGIIYIRSKDTEALFGRKGELKDGMYIL